MKRAYYDFFWQNLTGERFKWNYFKGIIVIVFIAIMAVCFLIQLNSNKKIRILNWICLVVCIALIPMAANICVILAPKSSFWEQQTAPIALILPCAIWNFERAKVNTITVFVTKKLIMILSVVMIWGSAYQVVVDQESMREGINISVNIGKGALDRMFSSEEYDSGLKVAVIGAPFNNSLYYDTEISKKANIYTRIGGYSWWGNAFDLGAWRGIIRNRIGYRLNYCEDSVYNDLCEDQRVLDMKSYPDDGCVQVIDDVLIVKIANPQNW